MNVPTVSAALVCLAFASCDTFNRPIDGASFDPLRPPGADVNQPTISTVTYRAGQFVRASLPNTAFYKNRPKDGADADRLLDQGTSMKVISTQGSFVRVELDSGEVGFVPMVMVEDPNAAASSPYMNPNEFQIYPPPGGYGDPLPPVDPAGLPPEGSIPTVIDPEAPVPDAAVPPVTSPGDDFAAPSEPAPLPPNDEELEQMRNNPE